MVIHNFLSPYIDTTGNTLAIVVTAGVTGTFILLTLLTFTSWVITVVVLRRRAWETKRNLPHGNGEPIDRNGTIEKGRATEEEGTLYHIYDTMDDESSIDGREAVYEELDVGTQDYMSVYAELRKEIYQEVDPQGMEKEHNYQKLNMEGEGHGERK